MRQKSSLVLGIAVLTTLAACGGGGGSDNTDDSIPLVKNRPLNNCVTVMGGGRPTKPLTKEELIKQREAEIAAMPEECRPKRKP